MGKKEHKTKHGLQKLYPKETIRSTSSSISLHPKAHNMRYHGNGRVTQTLRSSHGGENVRRSVPSDTAMLSVVILRL